MSKEVNSLLDLLDGSHKTGEIAYFGVEGENVRVLGERACARRNQKEPDTKKQREFQMAKWIANSLLRDG